MSKTRDPRTDPQPGDTIKKESRSPNSDFVRTRLVLVRDGNDIFYRDQHGKERKCWISSWQEWASLASVEGEALPEGMDDKNALLKLVEAMPLQIKRNPKYVAVLRKELTSENEIMRAFRVGLRRVINEDMK